MAENGGILILLVKKIYTQKLNKYREKVEEHIRHFLQITVTDKQILEMLEYTLQSGRRFRPLLFILAHKVFKKDLPEKVYQIAASMELLHKASLIHDDLLDGDEYRRGKESFYHKYGEKSAVIAGDLLVSLAYEHYLQAVHNPYLIKEWSKLYRLLAMGEMQDLVWEHNWQKDPQQIMGMIYGKTASFLEFAMKAGTYLATQDSNLAEQMGQFGTEVGFTFQIMNDLNNWDGLEQELGRQPKNDINIGKINLVTRLVHQYHSQDIPFTRDTKEKLIAEVKIMAKTHITTAYDILNKVGVKNRYTEVLIKILKEFDQEWFWVDRDDK